MSRGFVYQQGVLADVLERRGKTYRFEYEPVCAKLHLPQESRLALDLFANERPYLGEDTHGFLTGASWLEFADAIGIKSARALRFLKSLLLLEAMSHDVRMRDALVMTLGPETHEE